ncbi:hypothetical protein CYMTET_24859 [Cymbomonas tetramitiformis]|uniref:Peroxidase n=1 Tax=Cymbomonas tetramitiformis TaxID=36881 RepID=A0AAE0FV03_9CHLO|nr:hypothetical protein CYMTET_24859 [Cymbomonas tetramitiformis]
MCSCNSHMLMEWGQFLDHDITFTPQVVLGAQKCSSNCSMDNTETCYPIPILEGDPDFEPGTCIKFTRSDAACGTGLGITGAECDVADSKGVRVTKHREQLNGITSYIDASQVYGSDQGHADALRERASARSSRRGRLRVCDEKCLRRVLAQRGLPEDLAAGLGDFPPFDLNAKGGEGGGDAEGEDDAACSGGMSEAEEGAESCDLPGATRGTDGTSAGGTCNATCSGRKKATSGNCGGQLPCFSVGDVRGNENIGLTSLQTLFLREHNRLAGMLAELNPIWSDEEVYQEARKIVGAEMQILTYKEYYPANMGIGSSHVIEEDTPLDHLRCPHDVPGEEPPGGAKKGLFGNKDSCDWYDQDERGDTTNEFSTAGFRLGHTQVGEAFERYAERNDGGLRQHPHGHVAMRHAFFNSSKILLEGGIEPIFHGLANQDNHGHDAKLTYDLGGHLFGPPGPKGLDLVALNIQRGRDHGLPTFNEFRRYYHLPTFSTFSEAEHERIRLQGMNTFLSPKHAYQKEVLSALNVIYRGDAEKLDAWVGLLAEMRLPRWEWGITLTKLLADQFKRYRNGDRLFWTNSGVFTSQQREALSHLTLAGIICANTNIQHIQPNVFKLPTMPGNSRRPCASLGKASLQTLLEWKGPSRKGGGTLGKDKTSDINAVHPRRHVLQDTTENDQISINSSASVAPEPDAAPGAEPDLKLLVDTLPRTTPCPSCQAMVGACEVSDVPPLETHFIQFEAQFSGDGANPVTEDQGIADNANGNIDFGLNLFSFRRLLLQADANTSSTADGGAANASSQTTGLPHAGNNSSVPGSNSARNVYRRAPGGGSERRLDGAEMVQAAWRVEEREHAWGRIVEVLQGLATQGLAGVAGRMRKQGVGLALWRRLYRRQIANIAGVNESDVEIRLTSKSGALTLSLIFGQLISQVNASNITNQTLFSYDDGQQTGSGGVFNVNYPVTRSSTSLNFLDKVAAAIANVFKVNTSTDVKTLGFKDALGESYGVVVDLEITYAESESSIFGVVPKNISDILDNLRENASGTDVHAMSEDDVSELIASQLLAASGESLQKLEFKVDKAIEQDTGHAKFMDYTQVLSMEDCVRHEDAARPLNKLMEDHTTSDEGRGGYDSDKFPSHQSGMVESGEAALMTQTNPSLSGAALDAFLDEQNTELDYRIENLVQKARSSAAEKRARLLLIPKFEMGDRTCTD